jgi:hypothetical protein
LLSPARRSSAAPPSPRSPDSAPKPDILALCYVRRSEFRSNHDAVIAMHSCGLANTQQVERARH